MRVFMRLEMVIDVPVSMKFYQIVKRLYNVCNLTPIER